MQNVKAPLYKLHPAVFIVITLIVVFVTYQVFGGLLTYIITGSDLKSATINSNYLRIIISFSQFMFLLVPTIVLSMMQGNEFTDTFRFKKPLMPVFFLGLAGIIVVQPVLQIYMLLQNKLIFSIPFLSDNLKQIKELFDSLEAVTLNLVRANSVPEFILVVIVIAVTPAVCEEFLFRGLIFKNFERSVKSSKAIFLTGLLFALFHFHPFNIIPLIILGFFLTFVVYYSGSILTAVSIHFVNNFISAFAVYKYGKEDFTTPDISGLELVQFIILGLVSLVLFLAVLISIKKISDKKLSNETNEQYH